MKLKYSTKPLFPNVAQQERGWESLKDASIVPSRKKKELGKGSKIFFVGKSGQPLRG